MSIAKNYTPVHSMLSVRTTLYTYIPIYLYTGISSKPREVSGEINEAQAEEEEHKPEHEVEATDKGGRQ